MKIPQILKKKIIVIPFCLVFVLLLILLFTLPNVEDLKSANPTETAMMRYRAEQDARNKRKTRKQQKWVRLSLISPYLIHAVIISEDDKFYEHEGFDWESMNKALEKNISKKKIMRGGSTISQQLAKNLYLSPSKNPIRKIREAIIAHSLEKNLSKKRILEIYLNVIEWGQGIYGIEAASNCYFNKSASSLSPAEAIRLASVLPNPIRFSAITNSSRRMTNKRKIIAARMLKRKIIDEETYQQILTDIDPENHPPQDPEESFWDKINPF